MQKISQAWWQAPVIPLTWEAEAGEWHQPGRRSLQWAEIAPLHSNMGDRARPHLKKKKKIQIQYFLFFILTGMSFTQQIHFRPGALHVLSRRMWWVTETILHVCALFTAFFLTTDSTSCFSAYAVIICWVLHIVGNMLSTLRIPNLPLKLSSSCFSR